MLEAGEIRLRNGPPPVARWRAEPCDALKAAVGDRGKTVSRFVDRLTPSGPAARKKILAGSPAPDGRRHRSVSGKRFHGCR